MLSSMTENKRSTYKLLGNLDQIAPNLCNSKSRDPLLIFVKCQLAYWGYSRQINITFKFTKKLSFGENW